jgi:hypothetical protein
VKLKLLTRLLELVEVFEGQIDRVWHLVYLTWERERRRQGVKPWEA